MKAKSYFFVLAAIAVLTFLMSACGTISGAAINQTDDKLAEIKSRGTLIIATNQDYFPFSTLDENQTRVVDTKCSTDQYTSNQLSGFDIGTAIEIAKRLGVEPCFVTPDWEMVIVGNWNNAWDIHIGSMSITKTRMDLFYFSQPYYATPSYAFVHENNINVQTPEELSGKKIGTCIDCTFEFYLRESLDLPGPHIEYRIKGAEVFLYDTEIPALEDLSMGDGTILDAVLTQRSTGIESIKNGAPLRMIAQPLFFEYTAAGFDKNSGKDSVSLVKEITKIIQAMQNDGTLLSLAKGTIEADLIPLAADFYIDGLNQFPK